MQGPQTSMQIALDVACTNLAQAIRLREVNDAAAFAVIAARLSRCVSPAYRAYLLGED